ncbi:MAG: hypothetical protein Q4D32_11610 [Eubacteriales bacterium]|nr:hypothetical protein [Eubacteriales bacterium]
MLVFVIVYLVFAVIVNMIWARQLNKQIFAVVDILERDKDPDRYLQEMERLTGALKSGTGLQIYYINMAVGYMAKDDYETALRYMQQIPSVPGGSNRVIYWMDLAYCYFHMEKTEEAMEIMRRQKKVFQEKEQNPEADHILCLLYELYIFENSSTGNREEAMRYYEKALPLWEKRNRDEDRAYMLKVIHGES